jgi:hypothetical protein
MKRLMAGKKKCLFGNYTQKSWVSSRALESVPEL